MFMSSALQNCVYRTLCVCSCHLLCRTVCVCVHVICSTELCVCVHVICSTEFRTVCVCVHVISSAGWEYSTHTRASQWVSSERTNHRARRRRWTRTRILVSDIAVQEERRVHSPHLGVSPIGVIVCTKITQADNDIMLNWLQLDSLVILVP